MYAPVVHTYIDLGGRPLAGMRQQSRKFVRKLIKRPSDRGATVSAGVNVPSHSVM